MTNIYVRNLPKIQKKNPRKIYVSCLAILFECQVDHDNADKSIDEIKTTNREVVPEIRDVRASKIYGN